MVSQNIINLEKKGKIEGLVFDSNFSTPIVWGSKNIVMTWVKKLDELTNTTKQTKVRIYSYLLTNQGYRRIDIYNGPIETIGKYIRRY